MMATALMLWLAQDRVAELVGRLADANSRAQAADELVKIGKPAVEALEKDGSEAAKDVLNRICWPGVAELQKVREGENGEPRIQLAEVEDAPAYERFRKMFPDHRVFRISYSTLQGTFSHAETYVVEKFNAKPLNMSKMPRDQKSGWLSQVVKSRELKAASEAEITELVAIAGLMLGPLLYEAECINGTGRCGGATLVKKTDSGWEYYQESCGEYATLHQIWVLEVDKEGRIQKITLNPDGKKFTQEKK